VAQITHVPPLLAEPLVPSGRSTGCLRGGRDRLSGTGPIGWPRNRTGEGGLIGDPTSLLVQHGAHHGPGNRDQDHDRRGVGGHRQDRHCSGGREHEQADPGPQTPWIGLPLGHGIPPCWPPTSFSFVSARQRYRAELPVRHARGVLAPCGNAPRSGSPCDSGASTTEGADGFHPMGPVLALAPCRHSPSLRRVDDLTVSTGWTTGAVSHPEVPGVPVSAISFARHDHAARSVSAGAEHPWRFARSLRRRQKPDGGAGDCPLDPPWSATDSQPRHRVLITGAYRWLIQWSSSWAHRSRPVGRGLTDTSPGGAHTCHDRF
jgi:hypothetical protein